MTQADLLERLRSIATGNIADALVGMGLTDGVLDGIRPISADQRRFAGPAFTVRQRGKPEGTEPGTTRHLEVIDHLAKPGDVVVIDVEQRPDVCSLGGLLTLRAAQRGLEAIVVNGSVRDVAEIRASGLPVSCTGASPRKSSERLETASIAETLRIGDCEVSQGDIIVGDETGVLSIPQAVAERVLAVAESIRDREGRVAEQIRLGVSITDAKNASKVH